MENGYTTRVLICIECGEEFAFTAAAQEYFAERGYTDDPKRCKSCHMRFKKSQRTRNGNSASSVHDAEQLSD
jgi:DNA-directed RNA polymerase subunit RPC12/RpoP